MGSNPTKRATCYLSRPSRSGSSRSGRGEARTFAHPLARRRDLFTFDTPGTRAYVGPRGPLEGPNRRAGA